MSINNGMKFDKVINQITIEYITYKNKTKNKVELY